MADENENDVGREKTILANCRSYILFGEDCEHHKDSRKATVYTNPFFRIPADLLPPFVGEIYDLVKRSGFKVEPIAYITNISKLTNLAEPERNLSVYWMTEGVCGVEKRLGNHGCMSLKASFYSLPFSKNDLDYAHLGEEIVRHCGDFDLYKLMERSKWRTVLRFGLERWLNDSIMHEREQSPITLIEGAGFYYHFNSNGEFERISKPHADFICNPIEYFNRFKEVGVVASVVPTREPRAWKKEEFENKTNDYSEIVQRYFLDTEIKEEELLGQSLENVVNVILPKLIRVGVEFIEG